MPEIHTIADRDVLSLTPAHTIAEARQLFTEQGADVAVVLHEGRVLGLLSRDALDHRPGDPGHGEWKLLVVGEHELDARDHRRTIADVPLETPHPFPPETTLELAADYARRTDAKHLLVLDQGRLVGVVPTSRLFATLERPD